MQNFWNIYHQQPPYPFPKPFNQHRGKYKRSTNNSHKKFICVARKLLLKGCSQGQRAAFEKEFDPHKNSRTYFFIILAHAKIRMTAQKGKQFSNAFVAAMTHKIQIYHRQIQTTNNNNFIHFRFEEIADIEFAIKAMELYFKDQVEDAIQTVYRKDRLTLFKRQQYDSAVKTILELQKRLRSYPPGSIFPYLSQQLQRQENPHSKQRKQAIGQKFKQRNQEKQQISNQSSDQQWQADIEESAEQKKYKSKNNKPKSSFNKYRNSNDIEPLELRPLLCLQNSYPYFSHFYSTIFTNDFENPHQSASNLSHSWNIFCPPIFRPKTDEADYINPNLFPSTFNQCNQIAFQVKNSSILQHAMQSSRKIEQSAKILHYQGILELEKGQTLQMGVKRERQESQNDEIE